MNRVAPTRVDRTPVKRSIVCTLLLGAAAPVLGNPPLMSQEWTTKACEQWHRTASLTDELADQWVKNDDGKGFKVVQLYCTDCGEASRTELRIAPKDGKAMCVYGGKLETAKLDSAIDCVMHATCDRWGEMRRGDYGPLRGYLQTFAGSVYQNPRSICPRHLMMLPRLIKG
jgi:putative sterol carrier protein